MKSKSVVGIPINKQNNGDVNIAVTHLKADFENDFISFV